MYALASSILPLLHRDKRVESKRTGSDRNFTGMFTCVLKFFNVLKNEKKRKQRMKKKSIVKYEEVGNIEKKVFVILRYI